jgi:mono/diheme cytochrome c family protein
MSVTLRSAEWQGKARRFTSITASSTPAALWWRITRAGVMPANYSEQLSVQELADLIAYLLQQNEASGS